jgi:hypothetical protein
MSQSSLISERTAEASRRSEASFGKSVATRVRRLMFLLSRSSPLVVRSRRRWAAWSRRTARASGTFSSSQAASCGAALW